MSAKKSPSLIPAPSRLMLNVGIIAGGVIGFVLQAQLHSDDVQAFLITGGCALLGVIIASQIDIRRQKHKKTPPSM